MHALKLWLVPGLFVAGTAVAAGTAGDIKIIGSGEASASPEVAHLAVTVTSICYDSSRAAQDANAKVANEVLAALKAFALDAGEQVTASGGPNTIETEYTDGAGGTRTVLCARKWRSTNTLTLTTKHLTSLPDAQDAVLAAAAAQGVNPGVVAQTYAELGQPYFSLTDATQKALRSKAQNAAWDDAKAQFDTFAARCSFQNVRLVSVLPPSYNIRVDMPAPSAGSVTPIIPEAVAVTATWEFHWGFDPTSACYAP